MTLEDKFLLLMPILASLLGVYFGKKNKPEYMLLSISGIGLFMLIVKSLLP